MPDDFTRAANDILRDTLGGMRSAIEGASPEILNRKPGGNDTNSIAVLAIHALHSTRSWLSTAVGAPLPARNRDDEFIATTPEAGALLSFVGAMQTDCQRLLENAGATDWAAMRRTHTRPDPDADDHVTAAWALLHAMEHLREHTGQMLLTRQLVDQGWNPPQS
jgi:uncharacterized damage-inducible protein DinB